jgi:hypothetical protein
MVGVTEIKMKKGRKGISFHEKAAEIHEVF